MYVMQYGPSCEILQRGRRRVAIRVVPQTAANAARRRDHRSQTERAATEGGRGAALTAGGAAMLLVAGLAIVTFASPGSHAAPVSAARAAAQQAPPAGPLRVLSVMPAAGAKGVNGAAPIRLQFSAPLAANTPIPTLSPHIAGSWQVEGDTAVFTPASGYFPNTRVALKIPGGPNGMTSVNRASAGTGGLLASSATQSFTTGSFSTLRLQQLLSQLGYLPLTWTPKSKADISASNANAELSAATSRPRGRSAGPATTRRT
jgi:Bacterial Ig-like domain